MVLVTLFSYARKTVLRVVEPREHCVWLIIYNKIYSTCEVIEEFLHEKC